MARFFFQEQNTELSNTEMQFDQPSVWEQIALNRCVM